MNEKLREVIDLIPVIKEVGGKDTALCVWNENGEVEAYFPSKSIDIDFPVGFKVPDPNDLIYQSIKSGKVMYNVLPKEVFGVAFEGKIIPIFDGGKVVGVLTYIFSSERKEGITDNVNELTKSMEKTTYSINEIADGAEHLSENMNNVQNIVVKVDTKLEEAMEVVAEIKQNAKHSNILALNASIESARAGEAGKGFAIVSDEMRKFSKISGEASEKINRTLSEITLALEEVKKSVINSTEIAKEQAGSVNELTDTFREVNKSANRVSEICKDLNKL